MALVQFSESAENQLMVLGAIQDASRCIYRYIQITDSFSLPIQPAKNRLYRCMAGFYACLPGGRLDKLSASCVRQEKSMQSRFVMGWRKGRAAFGVAGAGRAVCGGASRPGGGVEEILWVESQLLCVRQRLGPGSYYVLHSSGWVKRAGGQCGGVEFAGAAGGLRLAAFGPLADRGVAWAVCGWMGAGRGWRAHGR